MVPASVLSVAGRNGDERPAAAGEGRTLPLAAPVIIAGANVRDNQHWYGNHRLDGPEQYAGNLIIIGLSGFNTAYIIQGGDSGFVLAAIAVDPPV